MVPEKGLPCAFLNTIWSNVGCSITETSYNADSANGFDNIPSVPLSRFKSTRLQANLTINTAIDQTESSHSCYYCWLSGRSRSRKSVGIHEAAKPNRSRISRDCNWMRAESHSTVIFSSEVKLEPAHVIVLEVGIVQWTENWQMQKDGEAESLDKDRGIQRRRERVSKWANETDKGLREEMGV